ncbi:conserved protein, unknown function [Hepatocystis sp. ex Piliocolobus tephrosceles]|nr:conserved protein, unknown function [Hepatocystis sp. ex Piliocolobus tephrosceles]
MLWKKKLGTTCETSGRQELKQLVPNFNCVKQTVNIFFNVIYRRVYGILSKCRVHLKTRTKYIYYNTIEKLYILCVKLSHFKIYNHTIYFISDMINKKLKKHILVASCEKKKKKNDIKNDIKKNINKKLKDINELKSNNHYIIDLYNETFLQNELNDCSLRNDKLNDELNYNTTLSCDDSISSENCELSSNSCLKKNDASSSETLEYDEQEVNESIKNCYLYNGYINADTYKKSEEYKFLKHHLNEQKNNCSNISIDVSSQSYDGQLQIESGQDDDFEEKADDVRIQIYKNENKHKNKKYIYKIYDTDTTAMQNMYCEQYLDENYYSSSYYCSSEDSDYIDEDDYTDNDYQNNYLEYMHENNYLCNYSLNSYDTIESI